MKKKKRAFYLIVGMVIGCLISFSIGIMYFKYYKGNVSIPSTNLIVQQNNSTNKALLVIGVLQKISKNEVITEKNLTQINTNLSNLPEGYYENIQDVIGKVSMIDLVPNTIITKSFLTEKTELNNSDDRLKDYELPNTLGLKEGQYIDIGIVTSDAKTSTVLSKKKIEKVLENNRLIFKTSSKERESMNKVSMLVKANQATYDISLYIDENQSSTAINYNQQNISNLNVINKRVSSNSR